MTISDVTLEAVTSRVRDLLASLLDLDPAAIPETAEILGDADSGGLELDSLDVVMLAVALADEYELSAPDEMDWSGVATVRDVAVFVHRLTAGR